MTTQFALQTIFEIILLAVVILSFVKEKKLIAFEEKIVRKLRARRARKAALIIPARKRGAHCA